MDFNFEFDPAKSASNKIKHGINFIEAQQLWSQPRVRFRSPHPGETRYLLIGKIRAEHWTAVITYRGTTIRIISVRKSNRDETRLYQKSYPS